MKQLVNDLLSKEMSRKEFLSTVGLGIISIIGFSSLIKLLDGKTYKSQSAGYGSSSYGGQKTS